MGAAETVPLKNHQEDALNGDTDDSKTLVRSLLIERAIREDLRLPAVVDRRQDELRRALRTAAGCWSAYSQEDWLPKAA